MNRHALVLGANAGQADLIRRLMSDGWRVSACAHKAGGPGAALADDFALVDIVDVDKVTALAKERGVDLVYSVSSDVAVPAVVGASKRLGLPHFFDDELVALLNSKPMLREHLNAEGLSVVPFAEVASVDELVDWTVYPCIVKPADSQGSRGVRKLSDAQGLGEAIAQAAALSRNGKAIIEQFLDGVELSSNVLVANGEAVINEVSERLVHPEPLVGIPSGHLIPPVAVDEKTVAEVEALVRAVLKSLRISDGTLYFQMKATSHGVRIVEIAPRLDGCHIWRLMTHACGVDFLELAVHRLLGETVVVDRRTPDAVYELIFQQTTPGVSFRAADFPPPSDALYHEHRYLDGEVVQPINGQLEVVGYYVRRRTEPASSGESL